MPIASVSAPKPSARPPLYNGPWASAEDRASLERQMIAELGTERAAFLRQWVALIGETVPCEVVEARQTKRTFQPTEYAIGHAVRRSPADAAAEFGVSETALGQYVRAADSLSSLSPGRVSASAAGGLNWERERLGDILTGNESSTIPAFCYQQHFAALPVFAAFCKVQKVEHLEEGILIAAQRNHRRLHQAVREHASKAGPRKQDRPVDMLKAALTACGERADEAGAARRIYYNLALPAQFRVQHAAALAKIDLHRNTCHPDIDLDALRSAIEYAIRPPDGQGKQNRPQALRRQLAEMSLRGAYLDLTGRERPDYTKRVGYSAGDGCPYIGPYVDFLRDCGRHYRLGSGPDADTLADLLPWQLKRPG